MSLRLCVLPKYLYSRSRGSVLGLKAQEGRVLHNPLRRHHGWGLGHWTPIHFSTRKHNILTEAYLLVKNHSVQ